MRSASILLLIGLTGCADLNVPASPGSAWAYIGNDPQGTENILMAAVTPVPQEGALTTTFRFQYTSPHVLAGKDGKSISYLETRDRVRVNCAAQTLDILQRDYYDVDGQRLSVRTANAASADKLIVPGGTNDLMYQAVCGRSVGWEYVGTSTDQTQKVYIMGKAASQPGNLHPTAWFKTVFTGPHSLVAAPSMQTVHYASKISTIKFNCPMFAAQLVHEVYYDANGHKVFDIEPPPGEHATQTVTSGSVRAEMYRAACGSQARLSYLGTDRDHTQKVYSVGSPSAGPLDTAQAQFRMYYTKPGRLTKGPEIQTVAYTSRSLLMNADCSTITYRIIDEKYLNRSGNTVFEIRPEASDAPIVSVMPGSLSEMLWKAACRNSH